ncbi:hypothetical protein L1887_17791 [Cichorium endivia]|nr:hypothetical protein L1887_17788 [Cichorium endivia]KAI3510659.1 hypothetical protein L1887_17791 [Cichorium endivia]
MGNAKNDLFWTNFAHKFSQKSGLEMKECMHVACQHYFDDLKLGYKHMRKTCGPYSDDAPSREYWGRLTCIFDGCTPSTSTGRSSQSRGSTSSIRSGHVKKSEIRDALAELAYSGDLDFDAIGRVEEYVTKCKSSLHIFMGGTKEYTVSVVRKFLGNDLSLCYKQSNRVDY